MNLIDWTALIFLAVLILLAGRHAKKNPCSGSCGSCSSACSRRDAGEVPDFVRRYRKDHPQKSR